jgi:hypothetical protein
MELHNPEAFYTALRKITGSLNAVQVDTITKLLAGAAHWPIGFVAYALATAWHEARLAPIHEMGGPAYLSKYDRPPLASRLGNTHPGDGIKYAGRGLVQLTGRANYAKASAATEADLITNPDFALHPDIAVRILIWGMETGAFTGRKLSDYIVDRGTHDAFVRCRKIINGADCDAKIAGYADAIQDALTLGQWK